MERFAEIEQAAIQLVKVDKAKEWDCHIQFVHQIAIYLHGRFGGNEQVIRLAAILHDVGRDKELPNEDHRVTGVRVAREFLAQYQIPETELELILQCIGNHDAHLVPKSREEKVVISADSASKLLHHQAFMLMCKKEIYRERAEWGLKYVEKGFAKIQIPKFKLELASVYEQQRDIYYKVLNRLESKIA